MSQKSNMPGVSDQFRSAAAQVLGNISTTNALPVLLDKLKDSDSQVRKQVVLTISTIDDPIVLPYISGMTSDTDWEVREAALVSLSKHSDKITVEPFIRCIKDKNEWVRLTAIRSLGLFPQNPMAMHILLQHLTDSNENILEAIIETLSHYKNRNVITRLMQIFTTSNERIQARIIMTLGDSLPDDIIYKLIKRFDKASQVIQLSIMNAFAESKSKIAKSFLISMLDHPNKLYRLVAARGLYVFDAEIVSALIRHLEEKDEMVIKNIMDSLYLIAVKNDVVINQLIDYLDELNRKLSKVYKKIEIETKSDVISESSEIYHSISKTIEALQVIGSKTIAAQFLEILRQPEASKRAAFRSKIQEIRLEGGKKHLIGAILQVLDFNRDWQRHEAVNMISSALQKMEDRGELMRRRLNVVGIMGRVGSKEAVNVLIKMLDDPEDQVKIEVIQSLGVIKDKTTIDPLISIWNKNDWIIRANIASTLGEIGHKRALDFLRESFKDKDPWVRFNIITAFDKIGDISAADMIDLALGDLDRKVRAAAVTALEHLPVPKRADKIIPMLNDPDDRVQANAIEALDHLSIIDPIPALTIDVMKPLLESKNNRVRANAARLAYRLDVDASRKSLNDMINSEDEWMRASACWAMGEINDEYFIPLLIRSLNDQFTRVRVNAIKSLSKYKNPVHAMTIINAIRKLEQKIRKETSMAIQTYIHDVNEQTALKNLLNT